MREMPGGARNFVEDAALTRCLQVVFEEDNEGEYQDMIVDMELRAQ
jgi:hypothetical protein